MEKRQLQKRLSIEKRTFGSNVKKYKIFIQIYYNSDKTEKIKIEKVKKN